MDGKVTPEDEIATVLHLIEGIVAAQGDGGAILLRKFGAQDESPIIQAGRMMAGLRRSAVACRASGSETERKALSSLWKRTPCRCSSLAMKE